MRRVLPLLLLFVLAGCGGDDSDTTAPRDGPPVAVERLSMRSDAVGERLEHLVLVPRARRESAPLLVLLHGQGGSPQSFHSDAIMEELARMGELAPVVLLPDGGEDSYWHDREDGDWAQMVLDEAIPTVARRYDASTQRVSIGGVSMGGFGALHLSRLRSFCSVSAHSAAVFEERPRPGSPFAEGFDSDADFARTDPIAHARELQPGIWIDVGDRDPFAPAVRELAGRMREPRLRVWRGGHDFRFWIRETPTWMRFHLDRLNGCGQAPGG